MNSNKIIEKIKALFRLADLARGASQHEAELALERATAMMAKYGIAQMEVEEMGEQVREARKFNIHERRFNTGRQKHADDRYIAQILRECFEVRIIWSSYYEYVEGWRKDWEGKKVPTRRAKQRLTYILVGEEVDTELAVIVIQELHGSMWSLYRAYLKDQGLPHDSDLYNSFFSGCANGFIDAANRGKRSAMTSSGEDLASRYAIVLVDKQKALAAYYSTITGLKASKGKMRSSHSDHAYGSGYEAGGRMKVGQRKLL